MSGPLYFRSVLLEDRRNNLIDTSIIYAINIRFIVSQWRVRTLSRNACSSEWSTFPFLFFLTCVTALFFDLGEEAACYVCKCLIMPRRYEGDTRETINTRKCAKNLHVAWGVGVLFWTKTETKSISAIQVAFTLFLSSANHSTPDRTGIRRFLFSLCYVEWISLRVRVKRRLKAGRPKVATIR